MALEKLKKDILHLIRTDEDFKLALIGALSTGLVTREETNRILKEIEKLRNDFNKYIEIIEKRTSAFEKRMEAFERRMEEMREDFNKRMEAFERRMEEMREDFNKRMEAFDIKLSSLGARWGIMSESAIRNALKELLSEKFGVKVSRWERFDEDGIVFGKPSVIDVDLVIKNKEHILVEIKSHIRKSDVAELLRISELYEKEEGVKPSLMIISPFVEEKAKEFAELNGVKIYTVKDIMQ